MSVPEPEQDHAWVSQALAADVPGPMPSHVTDRVVTALSAVADAAPADGPQLAPHAAVPPAAIPPAAIPPAAIPPAAQRPGAWPEARDDTAPQPPRAHGASRIDVARRAAAPPEASGPGADESPVLDDADGSGARSRVRVLAGGRRSDRAEAESDRRHFLLYRLLPVAASMVVLAAASGVVASQLGDDDEPAVAAQDSSLEIGGRANGPRPNGLVATGTAYTAATLTDQAAALLAQVAQGSVAARPEVAAGADDAADPAADPVPSVAESPASALAQGDAGAAVDPLTQSPLSSAAAFLACAQTLGAAEGVLPAAVDLATFDGSEAAVVVLPNRAGDGYEVIVTDRFCTPDTERASATFVDG